jgi:phytoene synthase
VTGRAATASPADAGGDAAGDEVERLRALMRTGSKSFFAASLLLPARVRGPATALYAYCRLADDAIDLGENPRAALAALHGRLDAVYDGRPHDVDADRALATVVHTHGIPRTLLDALLDGFLWDSEQRRCATLADLEAYAARVAGTVGAMMTLVMGTRGAGALARACDLGVAMQLTNIARDVGEDARAGRLYLPLDWLAQAGIDAEGFLAEPRFTPALARVVERLLAHAARLYGRAEHGIAALPRDCRPAIRAARLIYAEIGEQLAREGFDSIGQRTVVSRQRKLALLARATSAAFVVPGWGHLGAPALPAVQFLVDAAATAKPAHGHAGSLPAPRSIGWLIDLFERQAAPRAGSGTEAWMAPSTSR